MVDPGVEALSVITIWVKVRAGFPDILYYEAWIRGLCVVDW